MGKMPTDFFEKLHLLSLFSGKHNPKNSKFTLLGKNKILTFDAKITKTFNSFFKNVINTLNIDKEESILYDTDNDTDPLKIEIKKTPNTYSIKQLIKKPTEFYFSAIKEDLIAKEIQNLNIKTTVSKNDISVKILTLNKSFITQLLLKIFNKNIENQTS